MKKKIAVRFCLTSVSLVASIAPMWKGKSLFQRDGSLPFWRFGAWVSANWLRCARSHLERFAIGIKRKGA